MPFCLQVNTVEQVQLRGGPGMEGLANNLRRPAAQGRGWAVLVSTKNPGGVINIPRPEAITIQAVKKSMAEVRDVCSCPTALVVSMWYF